jgi:hypothetical protein
MPIKPSQATIQLLSPPPEWKPNRTLLNLSGLCDIMILCFIHTCSLAIVAPIRNTQPWHYTLS